MRVASIIIENLIIAQQQIAKVQPFADIIELRLDYLTEFNLAEIRKLREKISLPVLFTVRKQTHGGKCKLPETERLTLIQQLATLTPEYIDLEIEVPIEFSTQLLVDYPQIKLIRSYHNFSETPADLFALFQQMQHTNFSIIKIATFAKSISDTLRLLIFLQEVNQKYLVAGMGMGEYGQISRILAPVVGSPLIYGSVDAESVAAPGQLTLEELSNIYRVQLLNRSSKIYALLGDPVDGSIGHFFHNKAFAERHENAVYVKIKIADNMLAEAIPLFKLLPFAGFSVTMPHKETVVPFIDQLEGVAKAIGVVNTIKCLDNKFIGFNTDAVAGVEVLSGKRSLKNSQVLILGAGGSAKAIAYALHEQGAKITICNRTIQSAKIFTDKFAMQCIGFEQLFAQVKMGYDVIINTLPVAAFNEQIQALSVEKIHASACKKPLALDIVYQSKTTPFIQLAQIAGWDYLEGETFYISQALAQLTIWLGVLGKKMS